MQRALRAQCERIMLSEKRDSPVSRFGCRHAKSATGLADVGRTRRNLEQEAYPSRRAGKIQRYLYTNDREPRKAANPGVEADAEATRSSRTHKKCGDVCKRRRRRSVLALQKIARSSRGAAKRRQRAAGSGWTGRRSSRDGERREKIRAASVPGDVVHATVRLAWRICCKRTGSAGT